MRAPGFSLFGRTISDPPSSPPPLKACRRRAEIYLQQHAAGVVADVGSHLFNDQACAGNRLAEVWSRRGDYMKRALLLLCFTMTVFTPGVLAQADDGSLGVPSGDSTTSSQFN